MFNENELMELEHRDLTMYVNRLAEVESNLRIGEAERARLREEIAKRSFYFQVGEDGIIEPGLGCC